MVENGIRRALVALVDAQVRFVVCGGVACILQGVARATHDLDVRVALDGDDLGRLLGVVRALGLSPRIPEPLEALLDPARRRAWVEEKNAVVYTLSSRRHLIVAKQAVQPPRKVDLRDIEDLQELIDG